MRLGCALAMTLVACGDGVGVPDAAAPDAQDDRGLVRVHTGSAGLTVYFQNADSTVALATRTDDDGDASALMAAGGFVTVFDPATSSAQQQLYTWTAVQPGDELTLQRTPVQISGGQILLRVGVAPDPDVFQVSLFTSCATFPASVEPLQEGFADVFAEGCAARQDLLFVQFDVLGRRRYAYVPNVDMLSPPDLDLRGAFVPAHLAVELTGTEGDFVDVRQHIDGLAVFELPNQGVTITNGHGSIDAPMPTPAGKTIVTIAETGNVSFPPDGGEAIFGRDVMVAWGPGSTVALDVTRTMREVASRPAFDPRSDTITWTETEGMPGNAVFVNASFTDDNGVLIGWKLVAARPTEPLLRAPRLPDPRLRPRDAAGVFVGELTLIEIEGGYDRVRPHLLGAWTPSGVAWWPIDSASGRVRYRSLN